MSPSSQHRSRAGRAEAVQVELRRLAPHAAVRAATVDVDNLSPAHRRRQAQYSVGRSCVAACFRELGLDKIDVGRGALGEPLWPEGFDGSISHTYEVAASLVWRAGGVGTGLDLFDRNDEARLLRLVPHFLHAGELPNLRTDALVLARAFSAKEAATKRISPVRGGTVDPRELTVHHMDPTDGRLFLEAAEGLFSVRQSLVAGLIVTVAQG